MAVAEVPRLRVVPDDHGPRLHCLQCKDEPAAWRLHWCAGVGEYRSSARELIGQDISSRQCGRRHDHHAHTYAERCGCSDTNPVIAAHRRRLEEFRTRKAAAK